MIKEFCSLIGREHFDLYNLWTRIFTDIWVGAEKQSCNGFHFRFFPAKSNKTFWKPILDTFCPFKGKKNSSGKSTYHFFQFLNFYRSAKFQKKITNRFCEKLVTDVQKKHEFTEPPLPKMAFGVKKGNKTGLLLHALATIHKNTIAGYIVTLSLAMGNTVDKPSRPSTKP